MLTPSSAQKNAYASKRNARQCAQMHAVREESAQERFRGVTPISHVIRAAEELEDIAERVKVRVRARPKVRVILMVAIYERWRATTTWSPECQYKSHCYARVKSQRRWIARGELFHKLYNL